MANNKKNQSISFILMTFMLVVPSIHAEEELNASFKNFGHMLMLNSYSDLNEEEKLETLKFLASYLKTYDRNLYQTLQNELITLSSLNRSSLELINKVNCKEDVKILPHDNYQDKLNKYRCNFLNTNAQKKFLSLENIIDHHLTPLVNELEQEMTKKKQRSVISSVQMKKAIGDLKLRIAKVKAIKNYYTTRSFNDAEREINQVINIFKT